MATFSEDGKHLLLNELQERNTGNRYLQNIPSIPTYPRPELHVTHLSHKTDLNGIRGIKEDGGFKGEFVWFSVMPSLEELSEANTRDMTLVDPGEVKKVIHPGEMTLDQNLLQKFASSPAFRSTSRYGSFCFTLSLKMVLDKYSQQFCNGQEPVLRVYKTVLYKQEVMYAVLVHSPDDEKFNDLPFLEEQDQICAFRAEPEPNPNPHFIWRPQAMSATHSCTVNVNGDHVRVKDINKPKYFVWDNVSLALHVGNQLLTFEDDVLRSNLWFCKRDRIKVREEILFQSYEEADREVTKLWPFEGAAENDPQKHLKRFTASQFYIDAKKSPTV